MALAKNHINRLNVMFTILFKYEFICINKDVKQNPCSVAALLNRNSGSFFDFKKTFNKLNVEFLLQFKPNFTLCYQINKIKSCRFKKKLNLAFKRKLVQLLGNFHMPFFVSKQYKRSQKTVNIFRFFLFF